MKKTKQKKEWEQKERSDIVEVTATMFFHEQNHQNENFLLCFFFSFFES